jgi:hypothetical protein
MKDFDENAFVMYSHVKLDAHVSAKNLENIEIYQLGMEVAWNTIA